MLGALGRSAKHRYGGIKPFESQWDANKGSAKHRISAEVADLIKTL